MVILGSFTTTTKGHLQMFNQKEKTNLKLVEKIYQLTEGKKNPNNLSKFIFKNFIYLFFISMLFYFSVFSFILGRRVPIC